MFPHVVCMCVCLCICNIAIECIMLIPRSNNHHASNSSHCIYGTSLCSPYILSGTSESQLNALTVAALKSHLKHFKLSVTGPKSALVNHLHLHLPSSLVEGVVDTQASDLQQSVTAQAGYANSAGTDANSLAAAPIKQITTQAYHNN